MRKRSTFAVGVAILWAAACGGEPFSTDGGAGSGGESAGSGGRPSAMGGSSSKAGSSAKGGSSGNTSNGGSVGGDLSIGGVVGVSGSTTDAGSPSTSTSCSDPSDCEVSSRCVEATCSSGECGEKPLPDGPFNLQVPGDCKQARCEGGHEVLEVDANDSDDKAECTVDSCDQNGVAKHTPMVGAACGNGGLCGPDGKCSNCNVQLCPADACHVNYCSGNECKLAPKPAGSLCPNTANDYNQCDGQGACVDCVDNGGCNQEQVCDVASHVCKSDTG
jgi:hypothetical protein